MEDNEHPIVEAGVDSKIRTKVLCVGPSTAWNIAIDDEREHVVEQRHAGRVNLDSDAARDGDLTGVTDEAESGHVSARMHDVARQSEQRFARGSIERPHRLNRGGDRAFRGATESFSFTWQR